MYRDFKQATATSSVHLVCCDECNVTEFNDTQKLESKNSVNGNDFVYLQVIGDNCDQFQITADDNGDLINNVVKGNDSVYLQVIGDDCDQFQITADDNGDLINNVVKGNDSIYLQVIGDDGEITAGDTGDLINSDVRGNDTDYLQLVDNDSENFHYTGLSNTKKKYNSSPRTNHQALLTVNV